MASWTKNPFKKLHLPVQISANLTVLKIAVTCQCKHSNWIEKFKLDWMWSIVESETKIQHSLNYCSDKMSVNI